MKIFYFSIVHKKLFGLKIELMTRFAVLSCMSLSRREPNMGSAEEVLSPVT